MDRRFPGRVSCEFRCELPGALLYTPDRKFMPRGISMSEQERSREIGVGVVGKESAVETGPEEGLRASVLRRYRSDAGQFPPLGGA